MFCENCGAQISNNDLFCQSCGKKVQIPTAQNAKPEPTPTVNQTVQQPSGQANTEQPSQTQTAVIEKPATSEASPNTPPVVNPYAQAPVNNPYTQNVQNNRASANNPYAQPQQNPYAAAPQNGQQFGYTPVPKKSGFKLNKKIVIIASAVAAVVIVGVIVLCVCIANANNPANKMIEAINAGDYNTAESIYYDNMAALAGNEDIINALQSKVDEIKNAYKNGDIDYETAKDRINDLYSIPIITSTDISQASSYLYDLYESSQSFDKAEKYLNDKNYENAIYYYNQVIEDDKNYKTAQSQKSKAVDGIRQEYLDKAKKEFDNGNYSYAISYLQNGLENEYIKDDSTLNKQIETYVNDVITKSDTLLKEKKYEDASDLINGLQSSFDEDSTYYNKLSEQSEKLSKEIPATLHDMDINNSDYFYRYQSGSKDVLGNVYDGDNVCTMSVSKYSADKGAYAEMYVKDYKKIMGTLAVENNSYSSSNNIKAYIEILGDNKRIYKSETFTNKSKPVNFEVDITNVEWLQIKLTYVSGSGYMDIILSDVELYKIGSSAPDAPAASEPAAESSKPESSKAESSNEESSKTESSKSETASKPAEESSKNS